MRQSVKRRMWSRVGVIAAVAVSAVGLSLAPAGAVTDTTIGQTGGAHSCYWPTAWTGLQSASTSPSYAVPAGGGLVTSWSVQEGASGGTYQLAVWRPTGGSSYTLVGTAPAPQTIGAGSAVHTYALTTPIAVQAGDVLGLQFGAGPSDCEHDGGSNVSAWYNGALPSIGTNLSFSLLTNSAALNVAATVTTGQCGPGFTAHYSGFSIGGAASGQVWCVNAQGIGTLTIPGLGTAPAQIIRAGNIVWFSANGNNLRVSGYLNTANGASSVVVTKPLSIAGKVLTFT
jgi:hypothetical protein